MKILKYILYAIIALVVIFLLMGMMNPEISYGHKITVDKSAKEAWAVSQDEDLYKDWLEGFQSMELLEGEKGKAGSKYKIVVNPGDGQDDFEMVETLLDIQEFKEVTMTFDSDMMGFDQTIYFEEEDGKTNIWSDSKVKGKGIMMKSMFAVMEILGGSFTAQEAKNFEALKVLINENTKDYFPAPEPIMEEGEEEGAAEATAEATEG